MFTDPQTATTVATPESTRKFMFERSFDASASARAPERKPVTLKPDQYDALKKESFDSGFEEGRKAGLDEQTAKLAAMIANVGNKLDAMISNMLAVHKEHEAGMRKLAIAIVQKILPETTSRNGLQEIEAMLSDVISEMVHEPRLVVRVNEAQFDVLNDKISALAGQKAYAGKVVVLADAEVAAGDCRIEWADGGMERNTKGLMDKIEKTVAP